MNRGIAAGIVISLLSSLMPASSHAVPSKEERLRNAIVKIHTVSSAPDYMIPWQMGEHERSGGSGCIIAGKRILTNAHVVSDSKYIQVQPYGSPDRYNATVEYVSHEADLAVLKVEEGAFFAGRTPLEIGGLPETLQEVFVYGYPLGGEALSITRGILSRVVYDNYVHSSHSFMAGQVDAAINPGNSGGPVIVGGRVVGVVMQGLEGENIENIGYMIPPPVIDHFLDDIGDGRYDGFPEPGFFTQGMENPGMRERYGMKAGQTGTLVIHVAHNAAAAGVLRKGDVLLSIDGRRIANDETVEFRLNERISYAHYADMHQLGEEIALEVLREGKVMRAAVRLDRRAEEVLLVGPRRYDRTPTYFIFGGIVFTPLTENLLCIWKNCRGPDNLMVHQNRFAEEKRRGIAVALSVLPAEINRGYHDMAMWDIEKVNGQAYGDFGEFYRLVSGAKTPFVVFEGEYGIQIVIDRKKAMESHEEILRTYDVKADRSADL